MTCRVKPTSGEVVRAAIVRALAAPAETPEPATRRRGPRSNPELTERELEVLAAIAAGQRNPQIAAAFHLSPKTVMHDSTSVYRKLGVRGRPEAVALAYRTGLLADTSGGLTAARPAAGHYSFSPSSTRR
jgi:DNA-binding NarL/FixJ family response regulator